jgi:hypothetical protein
MLCLLVLTSSMLVQRISRMQQHHRRQHRIIKVRAPTPISLHLGDCASHRWRLGARAN